MRGEYRNGHGGHAPSRELPPRARRIPATLEPPSGLVGTTSACAENTLLSVSHQGRAWNYLRVRGEYDSMDAAKGSIQELPPRARRIPITKSRTPAIPGTTSACAENTFLFLSDHLLHRNYLRVRGEYGDSGHEESFRVELPPRARRILPIPQSRTPAIGTTSACAENTDKRARCGRLGELPPRARRILVAPCIGSPYQGTTSACAENTPPPNNRFRSRGNYLRVRGEYLSITKTHYSPWELPPRARRIRWGEAY